jgi:hypothetical protein
MSQLKDPTNENAARLVVLEFGIEVALAMFLSHAPPEICEQFKADFLRLMASPALPEKITSPGQEQAEAEISQRTIKIAGHLMEKVISRAAMIQQQRASRT